MKALLMFVVVSGLVWQAKATEEATANDTTAPDFVSEEVDTAMDDTMDEATNDTDLAPRCTARLHFFRSDNRADNASREVWSICQRAQYSSDVRGYCTRPEYAGRSGHNNIMYSSVLILRDDGGWGRGCRRVQRECRQLLSRFGGERDYCSGGGRY